MCARIWLVETDFRSVSMNHTKRIILTLDLFSVSRDILWSLALKVKKYKKTSRATSALDTSVCLKALY